MCKYVMVLSFNVNESVYHSEATLLANIENSLVTCRTFTLLLYHSFKKYCSKRVVEIIIEEVFLNYFKKLKISTLASSIVEKRDIK